MTAVFERRHLPRIEMPFPRNRHRQQDLAQWHTRCWTVAHTLMKPDRATAYFDDLRYTDLIGGYYVGAPLPVLNTINDFSLWFFVWDDRHNLDVVNRRQEGWSRLRDGLHAALDTPHRHINDPDPLISAFCDCVVRFFEPFSDDWNARFITHFHSTIDAYDQEYRNRTTDSVPTVGDYLALRRHTFGMWVWIDLLELAAGYELPSCVYSSSPYREAGLASQEFSAWYNDLHSMPKELAAGDFHNLGIVLAHHEGLTVHEAAGEVARRIEQRIVNYRDHEGDVGQLLDDIGADPGLRAGVDRCLFNMRNWISSVYYFHDESSRYQLESWEDPARPLYVEEGREQ